MKKYFWKFFSHSGTFRRFYVGVYTEKIAHRLTMRFSFPRIPSCITVSAQLNSLTSVIRSGADMPRQRAVRHVRRRKRCESTFRKESQATATRRNTWSRESIGTTLGQGFWRSRNSFGLSPETWYASAIA